MAFPRLDNAITVQLHRGTVVPAHPLALDSSRRLDEKRQRRLTRYYLSCGVGGLAVGVHTTQFEIRKPETDLLETVLRLAADEVNRANLPHPFIKVAGILGPVKQAIREARLAVECGYHLGLVSMGGLTNLSELQLIARARSIAEIIPIFGFYLQPAVGGRILSYEFWRDFSEIPNVYAVKIAAFNRYQTLDVVRAVCNSSRRDSIALYTGNDDNILADLITPYRFVVDGETVEKRFVGGLLGHWAVWTKTAVNFLELIRQSSLTGKPDLRELLTAHVHVTDMNAAVFDAANGFRGCIPGIHEVLRRQGLLEGTWCVNPEETLSPGQAEEIGRICESYPELTDDAFVKEFIQRDMAIAI